MVVLDWLRYALGGIKVIAKGVDRIKSRPFETSIDVIEYILGVKSDIKNKTTLKGLEKDLNFLRQEVELSKKKGYNYEQGLIRLENSVSKLEGMFSGLDNRVNFLYDKISSSGRVTDDVLEHIVRFQNDNQTLVLPSLFSKELTDLIVNPRYRIKKSRLDNLFEVDPEYINVLIRLENEVFVYSVPLGQYALMVDSLKKIEQFNSQTVPVISLETDVSLNPKQILLPRNNYSSIDDCVTYDSNSLNKCSPKNISDFKKKSSDSFKFSKPYTSIPVKSGKTKNFSLPGLEDGETLLYSISYEKEDGSIVTKYLIWWPYYNKDDYTFNWNTDLLTKTELLKRFGNIKIKSSKGEYKKIKDIDDLDFF